MSNTIAFNQTPVARLSRAVTALAVVSCLLSSGGASPLFAQQQPGTPRRDTSGTLKLFVLAGQDAVNRIPLGLSAQTVVEIRDQDDLPVEGADVVFTFPETGTSASINGQRQFRARTDNHGQAALTNFRPIGPAGPFQIHVEASEGGRTGSTVINQINSDRAIATTYEEPKRRTKRWLLLSAIGAGAAIGIILATRSNGSPGSSSMPIVLAPGPVSIGGPR